MNRDADNAERKRLRVLIADDTAVIRESMTNLISRLPDVEIVGQAQTGLEALEMMREFKPDVATLDIRMPGLSGIKVLEAIKKEGLPVSVIVMTGLDESEYRQKCISLGASYFFHKATEFELAVEIIRERAKVLNT